MEIKSFKKEKLNKYKIIFKDNTDITLYDDVIIKYNLLINKKLTDKQFEEIIKYNNNLDAYYLSLKYIEKKMRTKLEIKKYLEKKEIDNYIIRDTINKLEQNNIINEDLYIKSYCNDQINFNSIGPHKIASKLKELGIEKEKSYNYLDDIDNKVWIDKIDKIIDKKIKSNKNYSIMLLKNKIITSLINDGYDKELINEVLDSKVININDDIIIKEYNKLKNKLSKKYNGEELEFQIKMKLKSKGFNNEALENCKIM